MPTLPVLHVKRRADPGDARLLELIDSDLDDDDRHAEALGLLRSNAAMDFARADLERWANDARSVLQPLPDGPTRQALESLCDVVVTRTA